MKNHETAKSREISEAVKQAIRNMSDATKQAIKDMPVHWDDQERANYIITHADRFTTQYKTSKTDVKEEWPNIEDAKKAARFAANVSSRTGRSPTGRGIVVIAWMGPYDAIVEMYSGKNTEVEGAVNGKDT